MEIDVNYKDFSKRKPYNNIPCNSDEVLVPFVVTGKGLLTREHIDENNMETWNFKGHRIRVAFAPVKADKKDTYMKEFFNEQVSEYLKRHLRNDDLSLDTMRDALYAEDESGFDPTGTTQNEDDAFFGIWFQEYLEDLKYIDPKLARCIELLSQGCTKGEVIEELGLDKKKSQAYAYVKKAQFTAYEIYVKNYR